VRSLLAVLIFAGLFISAGSSAGQTVSTSPPEETSPISAWFESLTPAQQAEILPTIVGRMTMNGAPGAEISEVRTLWERFSQDGDTGSMERLLDKSAPYMGGRFQRPIDRRIPSYQATKDDSGVLRDGRVVSALHAQYGVGFVTKLADLTCVKSDGESSAKYGDFALGLDKFRAWTMWDVSGIPANACITDARISNYYTVCPDDPAHRTQYRKLTGLDPRTAGANELWNALDGDIYLAFATPDDPGEDERILPPEARTDLQNAIQSGTRLFMIGITEIADDHGEAVFDGWGNGGPMLSVSYEIWPTPTLSDPQDNLGCQPTSGNLTWTPVEDAIGYMVQIGTSPGAGNESAVTNPTFPYSGLQRGQRYWWRVKSKGPCGQFGAYSSSFSFWTLPPLPNAPALSAPPNDATCQPILGTLTWTAIPNAVGYQVQIGSSCNLGPIVDVATNSYDYELLPNTSYRWWVRTKDSCDQLGQFSDCFGFTTARTEPLPSPALSSPADGDVCMETNLTLYWSGVSGAAGYKVQIGTQPEDGPEYEVQGNSYPCSGLQSDTTCFWRVKTKDSCGQWGAYSDSRRFKTIPVRPATPVLSEPQDESICRTSPTTLSWSPVANATAYKVKVGTSCGSGTEYNAASTSLNYNGSPGGTYFWQVKAKDSCDQWGTYSDCFSYTVAPNPLSPPTLQDPPNAQTCVPVSGTLHWGAVEGATGYKIQLEISCNTGAEHEVEGASYSYSGLENNRTYNWRVKTKDSCGQWGNYGSCNYFVTVPANPLNPPSSYSPPEGTICQDLSGTLSWGGVSGAVKYMVQIGVNCGEGAGHEVSVPNFSYSGLEPNTKYYWHVKSKDSCNRWGDYGACLSFTTKAGSPPSGPTLLLPSLNTVCVLVRPTIVWSKPAGAIGYALQIGTICGSGATYTVTDTTYTLPSSLAYNTTYFWRVKAKDQCDQWSNYTECLSFKTIGELPSSPSQSYPASNAECIAISDTLKWNAVAGATAYKVRLGTTCGIGDEHEVIGTNYPFNNLENNRSYAWQVKTKDSCGQWGNYGNCSYFTTISANPLGAPVLASPADGAACQLDSGTLYWNGVSGAAKYMVQIGLTCGQGTDYDVTASQYTYSNLAPNTRYFWRVKTKDDCGRWGSYGTCFSFTTKGSGPPATPIQLSPASLAECVPIRPTLVWSKPAGGTSYSLQVGTNCGTGSTYTVTDTSYTLPSSLANNTTYCWRVKAKDACDQWSNYSDYCTFKTVADPPSSPSLAYPPNSATCIAVLDTVRWNTVAGATGYKIQLGTTCGNGDEHEATGTSYVLSGLEHNRTYTWHVKTQDSCGNWGNYGNCYSFTTITADPLPPPTLTSPSDGIACQNTSGTFGWGCVPGAVKYMVRIGPTCQQGEEFEVATCNYNYSGLQPGVTYFWSVRTRDSCGRWGSYSNCFSFTTLGGAPAIPSVRTPDNAATCQGITGRLTWSRPAGASVFKVQIGTTCANGEEVSLGDTSYAYSLSYNTTYYWRVKAGNSCNQWSNYSDCSHFTTGPAPLGAPALLQPTNHEEGVPIAGILDWADIGPAAGYKVQIGLTCETGEEIETAGSQYSYVGLRAGETYFWRVRPKDACGQWGSFSNCFSFRTADSLECYAVTETGEFYVVMVDHATKNGGDLEPGDQLAALDGNIVVGYGTYTGSYPVSIAAWKADPDNHLPGYVAEHSITIQLCEGPLPHKTRGNAEWVRGGSYEDGGYSEAGEVSFSTICTSAYPVLHPQDHPRWEMVGLRLFPGTFDAPDVFRSLEDRMSIVQDDAGGFYIPGGSDELSPLRIVDAYKIFTTADDTLIVTGGLIDPSTTPIPITTGKWNMIPYLSGSCDTTCTMNIADAMASIGSCVKIAKDSWGHFWVPSYGVNTIGNLKADRGYAIYPLESCGNLELTYPACGRALAKTTTAPETSHFRPFETGLSEAMIITDAGPGLLESGDEIAVYADDLLVGSAVYQGILPLAVPVWMADSEHDAPGARADSRMKVAVWSASRGTDTDLVLRVGAEPASFRFDPYLAVALIRTDSSAANYTFGITGLAPNPTAGSAEIRYSIRVPSHVRLEIYDVTGRLVRVMLDESRGAGKHVAVWDGRNSAGRTVGNGIYYARLRSGGASSDSRLVVIR
jgi:hypothetical protein